MLSEVILNIIVTCTMFIECHMRNVESEDFNNV